MYSASTQIIALDAAALVRHGVEIESALPPGLLASAEKRLGPWLSFAFEGASKLLSAAQLTGFAFGQQTPTPPHLARPAAVLEKLQTLGVPLEVRFEAVFAGAVLLVLTFLLVFVLQEAVEERAVLFPKQTSWRYIFLGFGAFCKLASGPGFLPLLKTLLWPVAHGLGGFGVQIWKPYCPPLLVPFGFNLPLLSSIRPQSVFNSPRRPSICLQSAPTSFDPSPQ